MAKRRELQNALSSPVSRAESRLQHIHRDRGHRTSAVNVSIDLATLSTIRAIPPSSSCSPSLPSGAFTISHHISHSGSGQEPVNPPVCQELIHLKKVRLNLGTYNIRGQKRFGRQCELSHLLEEHNLDMVGIQETKCSGNTLSTLAAGFLLNSSDNPFPGKEEHRGTGLIFRKTWAQALQKTYQGSSRWCGALFLANPVPLLILSVYAPTAAAEPDIKDTFYQDISEIIAENGGAIIVILGDFNARILTDPGLPRHVGPNIFRGEHPLGTYSEEVLDNRERFLDFLLQQDVVALNTLQEGPPNTQITFRNPGQPNFEPPWVETNFAQIDYVITKSRWRKIFSNVLPRPTLDFDSDHLPISATLTSHWKFGTQPKPEKKIRHQRSCTREQREAYNNRLRTHPLTWDTIQKNITETALETRGTKPPDIKKPYLKETTIELLKLRDEALAQGHHEQSRLLTYTVQTPSKEGQEGLHTRTTTNFHRTPTKLASHKKLETNLHTTFQQEGPRQGVTFSIIPKRLCNLFRHRTLETST